MKLLRTVLAAAALLAAMTPPAALAAGYGIYEQGAAVLGMAGAGTASVHDASALFFNPAALTGLTGTQLYLGGTLLMPHTSFAGVAPYPGFGVVEEMKSQVFVPPTFYLAHRYTSHWAVGAGLNSPFGLGTEWNNPDTFTGSYISTKGRLTTLNANLTGAYEINPMWSVAVGGDALFAKVELDRRQLAPYPGGGTPVDVANIALVSDWKPGYSWNAAISVTPNAQWKLGAFYRGKVVVDASGSANFTQILVDRGNPGVDTTFNQQVATQLPPKQNVSTVLRFPAIWSVGVAFMPKPAWTIEADVNRTEWSVFQDLPFRFDQTPSLNTTLPENYSDQTQVRVGFEHRLAGYTYRFGYYYDQAAAPSESVTPLLPDANRHGATFGLGWNLGADKRWSLDLYELALFFENRSTDGKERDDFNGTYKSYVNSAGASLTYHWAPSAGE